MYKEGRKHGFGIQTWTDGRDYVGHWWQGKTHGLGKYRIQNAVSYTYGLWEDGKQMTWWSEEQRLKIAAADVGEFDYKSYFRKEESLRQLS